MAKNRAHERKATMDLETARAFALEEFEKRHPRSSWPAWLSRCTVDSCGSRGGDLCHRIALAVTPKATGQPVIYFEASVDPQTAMVTVLIDRDPSEFSGEDLQGFHASTENPWYRA
jgi:hypothetical protein